MSSQVYECDPASGARVRRLTEPAALFAEAPPNLVPPAQQVPLPTYYERTQQVPCYEPTH